MTFKLLILGGCALLASTLTAAQPTATPNDIKDERPGAWALTGATIHLTPDTIRSGATLLIRDGMIEATSDQVPAGYAIVDLSGHHIYPALIDLDSQYGLPETAKPVPFSYGAAETLTSATPGVFNTNQAIRSQIDAIDHFSPNAEKAASYRELGFAAVLTHWPDGMARGTGALVSTADGEAALRVIRPRASAHYSFQRGSSAQSYPISMMGAVALLRQTHLDAQWYAAGGRQQMTDRSLDGWLAGLGLPQVFTVRNWQSALRAARLGQDTGQAFIIRGNGDEYQRIDAMAAAGLPWIVGLELPDAPDISDPWDAQRVSLADMKHWELAPGNAAAIARAGITFALTGGGHKDFWKRLDKAREAGLSDAAALAALTTTPARLIGESERLGHLGPGAIANLLVSDKELFADDRKLLEIWVQGQRHQLAEAAEDRSGAYLLTIGSNDYEMTISGAGKQQKVALRSETTGTEPGDEQADVQADDPADEEGDEKAGEADDGKKVKLSVRDTLVSLALTLPDTESPARLKGWIGSDGQWQGSGLLADGSVVQWRAVRQGSVQGQAEAEKKDDESAEAASPTPGPVIFPFAAYGQPGTPQAEDVLIRGATVWTLDGEGRLDGADVLVRNGKIAAVGSGLEAGQARVVDASGRHLTPGIIDEHSHIALSAVNDIATNSSMVRMSDVVDSEDVNIYRNLAGGVTAAQLLHGSANPIGGQSALVKMRWGALPQDMLIEGADGFIKFALGENVKRSSNSNSVRYPQTRMGVEQVFVDAFSAARNYRKRHDQWAAMSSRQRAQQVPPRRDLAMDTMLEILDSERFVTAHSYVQSEINMLMKVAERFDFAINTFTHILEGYKVADLMAAHGAGGSTFSDWWAYKWEVRYAIPYNAALMEQAGVTVAINSDSREMSRRLNQEAAKAVKYGGVDEVSALKMVTLNPARLLHLDQRMGSIERGKDADLVLWSHHPLSIDARVITTWVDGAVMFDHERDVQLRKSIAQERARLAALLQKQDSKGISGAPGAGPPRVFQCDSLHGFEYLVTGEVL